MAHKRERRFTDKVDDAVRKARNHPVPRQINHLYWAAIETCISLDDPATGTSVIKPRGNGGPSRDDITPASGYAQSIEWLALVEDEVRKLQEQRPRP